MKKLFISVFFSSVFTISAVATDSVQAPGIVFYKMPNGKIVERKVSLLVPSMGQGEVVLKYGDKSVGTTHFKTEQKHGRTNFIVAFKDAPGAPAGVVTVFTGSYMRGTNEALYYGDIYAANGAIENWETLLDLNQDGQGTVNYIGGFGFKTNVN